MVRGPWGTPRASATRRPSSRSPAPATPTVTAWRALGRLITYGHAGVEPRILQIGPVPAVRKVLDRSGLKVDEIDVFEVNEELAELET